MKRKIKVETNLNRLHKSEIKNLYKKIGEKLAIIYLDTKVKKAVDTGKI